MRTVLLSALAAGLSLGWGERVAAADEPRALIEKAVKAQGGAELLGRRSASQCTMKGSLHVGGMSFPFTGVILSQPGGALRYTMNLTVSGNQVGITQVINANKGWRKLSGVGDTRVEELDQNSLDEMKQSRYFDRVGSLLPLLKDKSFTLKALGELKVQDQPALGVQVSSKGQPDVKLYLHKTTGLLVKIEYRY